MFKFHDSDVATYTVDYQQCRISIHCSFTTSIQMNVGYSNVSFQLMFVSQKLDSIERVLAESD